MLIKKETQEIESYVCEVCWKESYNQNFLKKHELSHNCEHKDYKIVLEEEGYISNGLYYSLCKECKECGKRFDYMDIDFDQNKISETAMKKFYDALLEDWYKILKQL